MPEKKNKPNNFFAMTVKVISADEKQKKDGSGSYVTGTVEAAIGKDDTAVKMRFVANNGVSKTLLDSVGKTINLTGRVGYEEYENRNGETVKNVILYPGKIEDVKDKTVNYVSLTLRAGRDGEMRYAASGNAWGSVRTFLGMGKDQNDEYKPSLWLTVKGFTDKDGNETLPLAINETRKGDQFTASGHLTVETGERGGEWWSIMAREIKPFSWDNNTAEINEIPD